jgi:adenine phosphoribosyltransferase
MNAEPQHLELRDYVRAIPDFPKPGILFRDITPLLADARAFRESIRRMAEPFRGQQVDSLVAAEARGFIFAAPLAMELNAGFVPIRKPGKLPFDTHAFHYELEYGSDTLEIHTDGVQPGQRVLVVDDLLATGGTVEACCTLIEKMGVVIVGCVFAIELLSLGGARRIAPRPTYSLIRYD